MKKVISLLLALVMTLGLCSGVWATDRITDYTKLSDPGAVAFVRDYIDYNDGAIMIKGTQFDNGAYTQDSIEPAKRAIEVYENLSDAAKEALEELYVTDGNNDCSFESRMKVFKEFANGGGSQEAGNKRLNELSQVTQTFFNTYFDYNDGCVTPKNAAYEGMTFVRGVANARKAVDAIASLNDRSIGDELDALYVTIKVPNGPPAPVPISFGDLIMAFRGMLQTDGTQDVELRESGYVAPKLKTTEDEAGDFEIIFPEKIVPDEDYTWNYEDGTVTINVKKGNENHWVQAAQESNKKHSDGIYIGFRFTRPANMAYGKEATGNGTGGDWNDFVNGSVTGMHDFEEIQNGQPIAAVNENNGILVVTPNDQYSGNRMVVVWDTQQAMTKAARKFMIKIIVNVDESFRYEAEAIQQNVVQASRLQDVKYTYGDWDQTTQGGVLRLRPKNGGEIKDNIPVDGDVFGMVTIKQPAPGYELNLQRCIVNGGHGINPSLQTDSENCVIELYAFRNGNEVRARTTDYVLVWTKAGAEDYEEVLTVEVVANSILGTLGKYDGNGNALQTPVPTVTPEDVNAPVNSGLVVSYDKDAGYFETGFTGDDVPTVEQLRSGIMLTPPAELENVAKYRVTSGDGNSNPGNWNIDDIKTVVRRLYQSETKGLDKTDQRLVPFVQTNSIVVDGITVYFASTQQYRWRAIQWLNSNEEVLGYTFVYGKNSAFVNKVTSQGVAEPIVSDMPYVIGEGLEFTCKRFTQDGPTYKKYFRFGVSGDNHQGPYGVYLPYGYFGLTYEQAKELKNPPMINHYEEGDGSQPVSIVGKYTEYGIYFETPGFSPFTVTCDPTTQSQTTPPRYYYNSTTAADGKQEGGNSPTTFDAGIALYVGMALTSAAGMAWVGKKRR